MNCVEKNEHEQKRHKALISE